MEIILKEVQAYIQESKNFDDAIDNIIKDKSLVSSIVTYFLLKEENK